MNMVTDCIYIVCMTKPDIAEREEKSYDILASFTDHEHAEAYLASLGFEREMLVCKDKAVPTGYWGGYDPGYDPRNCDYPEDIEVRAWVDIVELHHPENCF